MKKILAFALAILLILAMPACVQEQTAEEETIGKIVTYDDFLTEFTKRVDLNDYFSEWDDYGHILQYRYTSKTDCQIQAANRNFQVEIDGIKVTLPLTVQEFADLGFALFVKNGDVEVAADLQSLDAAKSFTARTPKGNTVSIYGISKDYTPIALKDLIVSQVVCNFYQNNRTYGKGERADVPEIKFFENITAESTIDDMVKELKCPQQIYFTQVTNNGRTISTDLQMIFNFSNLKYAGHIAITTHATPENVLDRPCYTSTFHYALDYDTIRNG